MPEDLVYSPERPWLPPAVPVPFPEGRLTPTWVGKVAKSRRGEASVDVVVRSHLRPMHPDDPRYKAAWRTFWRALAFADRRNVEEMLHDWLAAATAAKQRPDLPPAEAEWINRFIPQVTDAINRLGRAKAEPMAWAGAEFSKYQPEQRILTEALIGAIALHRKGVIDDQQLYNILNSLDVDPEDFPPGINPDNLAAIIAACVTGEPLDLESTYRRSR